MSSPIEISDNLKLVSTYDEIADRARAAREKYTDLGIPLHSASELARLLAEADRVAADFREDRPLHSDRALVRVAHANRVASSILEVCDDVGSHECLRRMASGEMDLSGRARSQAKDALWEVELAARLKTLGLSPRFLEPDLVLTIDGQDYGVACKNINSEAAVELAMRKGVQQIEASRRKGIVAMNIESLTPADSILVSGNERLAGMHLATLNRAFIDRNEPQLHRYLRTRRCDAVLVTTSVVAVLESDAPRLNAYSQATLWHLPDPAPTSPAFLGLKRHLSNPTRAA